MTKTNLLRLFMIFVLVFAFPYHHVFASTISRTDLGIEIYFPGKYAVFSKAGIHNKNGIPDETVEKTLNFLDSSSIELIAYTRNISQEINIELFDNTEFNTFTFLTNTELSRFGKQFVTEVKAELKEANELKNVTIEDPTVFHHKQTNFILMESNNGRSHTYQYFTVYNNKAYRILISNHNSEMPLEEANTFIEGVRFLEIPHDYPERSLTMPSRNFDFSSVIESTVIGAVIGGLLTIPYILYKNKK